VLRKKKYLFPDYPMNEKKKQKFSLGDIIRKLNETPPADDKKMPEAPPPSVAYPIASPDADRVPAVGRDSAGISGSSGPTSPAAINASDTFPDRRDALAAPTSDVQGRAFSGTHAANRPTTKTSRAETASTFTVQQQPQSEESVDWDIMKYLGIFIRRKNIIFIALIIAAVWSVSTYVRAVKIYTAHGRMLFSPGYQDIMGNSQSLYWALGSREEKINTHLELLKSQTVLKRVAENLNNTIRPSAIAAHVAVSRGMTDGEKNDIIDIAFNHTNPDTARDIVNEICRNYLEYIKDVSVQDITVLVAKLEDQIAKKEKDLDQKENALRIFKESNRTVQLSSETNLTITKLSQIETARQQTQIDMLENKQKFLGLKNEIDQQQVDIIQSFTYQNPYQSRLAELELELSTLTAEYSPEHYKVRMAKAEIDKIKEAMKSDIIKEASSKTFVKNPIRQSLLQDLTTVTIEKSVLDSKRSAQEQISKELDGDLRKLPEVELQFAQLTRETESLLQVLKLLKSRYEEAKIKHDSQDSDLKILEWAQTPTVAVSTVKFSKIFILLFVGFIIGIAGAFLFEYLDQSIKEPQEIERILEVPLLGVVPMIETEKAIIESSRDRGKTVLEPFRALRANIKHIAGNNNIKSFIISSAIKGEGKTTFAANIAITFAMDGKKVILIDGDLRRAQMHGLFHLPKKTGLCDYLSGTVEIADILKPTVHQNLFVITAGEHPQNPAELVGSYRFDVLVKELRLLADIIIFDSPALLPVSDVLSMAPKIDACIMVVRALWTPSKAAQQAKNQLQRIGCTIIGAILNGISLSRGYYPYYYGYYRYYTYKYSYEDNNEPKFSLRKFGLLFESKIKGFFQTLRPLITYWTISFGTTMRRILRRKTFWILLGVTCALFIANHVKQRVMSNSVQKQSITYLGASKPGPQAVASPARRTDSTLSAEGSPQPDSFSENIVESFDSVTAEDAALTIQDIASPRRVSLPSLQDSFFLWQKAFNEKNMTRYASFYDTSFFKCRAGNLKAWETASDNILLQHIARQSMIRLSAIREEALGKSLLKTQMTTSLFAGGDTVILKISMLWQNNKNSWHIIRENQKRL
jgi:polysaccharide biosynthesis transport protein